MLKRPKVLSIRPERELCGVSYWAKHLEAVIRTFGIDVDGMTYAQFLHAGRALRADGVIAHVEIGTDSKNGDVFRLLRAYANTSIPRHARVSVVHSVFSPKELRMPGGIAHAAIVYQWSMYHVLARVSNIVTLSAETHEKLQARGIRNVGLTPGIYTSYLVERSGASSADNARLLVGLIGHPYRSKQYHKAAAAFAAMPTDVRGKAQLVILGGDTGADPDGAVMLAEAISSLPPEQVLSTGPITEDEFSAWLDRMDVAMMPYAGRTSSSAVFSRVVGHKIPAIVTPTPLFQPLIERGGAIATNDWPSTASTILADIINNQERLSAMKRGAEALAKDDSIESVAKRFLETLHVSYNAG